MKHDASLSFDGDLKRLTLVGTLSFATCMAIFNQSIPIILKTPSTIVIDFSEINCIDSSVIAVLVEWYKYEQIHPQSLQIIHLPEHIHSLLKIARLDDVLAKLFSSCSPS